MSSRSLMLGAVALTLGLAAAGVACDSGSESAEESTTTAATTTSEPDVETTTPAGGGDLVGQWTADAAEILAANLSNLGGVPGGLACSGPITVTFADDGTTTATGEYSCAVGGATASGSLSSSGEWSSADGELTVSAVVSEGAISAPGVEIPAPPALGEGSYDYTIVGDTLTIFFSDPNVGTVEQVYTRV